MAEGFLFNKKSIMKKIEIEISEGKEVQWVGDTLKLVDNE